MRYFCNGGRPHLPGFPMKEEVWDRWLTLVCKIIFNFEIPEHKLRNYNCFY